MAFAASIITLFPEAFPGTLGLSLIGKALRDGLWSLEIMQLRDFGQGPHKNVDDTPAGGGAGMVIRADVAAAAIDSIARNDRPLIYLYSRMAIFAYRSSLQGWVTNVWKNMGWNAAEWRLN